jgi:nucleolar GTP-binding protein
MPSSNPFRSIRPILSADELFEIAQKAVMKTSIRGTSESVPYLKRARKKEATRIELLSKELRKRLFQIVEDFPTLDEEKIPGFFIETLDISYGLDKIRQTLGSLSGSADIIWKIKREYLGDVWHASTVLKTKDLRRAAFGRMRSVIKKLNSRLTYLESVRQSMRLMPGIDLEMPTLCIVGYPNVGKSSLVNVVTSATPEIGSYPFTTKDVTLGHLEIPIYSSASSKKIITHIQCQLVDTPGILDRPITQRNEIELRAIAALKTLATGIIFIFDFTQFDAITAQLNLFKQTKSEFFDLPILLLFSKADLFNKATRESLEDFFRTHMSGFELNLITVEEPKSIHELLISFFKTNQEEINKIMNQRIFSARD